MPVDENGMVTAVEAERWVETARDDEVERCLTKVREQRKLEYKCKTALEKGLATIVNAVCDLIEEEIRREDNLGEQR